MSLPHSLKKYLVPYTSRCFACVKYLEASTMSSGSFQKKADMTNDIEKRTTAGFFSGKGLFEKRNEKKIPMTRIKKILPASTLLNTHCQLVSLLSSAVRKTKSVTKVKRVSRETRTT